MARQADIIISATGIIGIIRPEMIKKDSVLIDVGITRKITPGGKVRLMGDIHPSCRGNVSLTGSIVHLIEVKYKQLIWHFGNRSKLAEHQIICLRNTNKNLLH